jgi:hypothetical protein
VGSALDDQGRGDGHHGHEHGDPDHNNHALSLASRSI